MLFLVISIHQSLYLQKRLLDRMSTTDDSDDFGGNLQKRKWTFEGCFNRWRLWWGARGSIQRVLDRTIELWVEGVGWVRAEAFDTTTCLDGASWNVFRFLIIPRAVVWQLKDKVLRNEACVYRSNRGVQLRLFDHLAFNTSNRSTDRGVVVVAASSLKSIPNQPGYFHRFLSPTGRRTGPPLLRLLRILCVGEPEGVGTCILLLLLLRPAAG